MSVPNEHYRSIDVQPMLIPVPGMEPASVAIQFPESETGPSPLQLELLNRIRPEFPRLWTEALREMQADWGESEPILYNPVEAFWQVGVLIPPWEDHRDDAETSTPIEPSVENYLWEMFCAPAFAGCTGCHGQFKGLTFIGTTLYW